jgi:hypothetical protein
MSMKKLSTGLAVVVLTAGLALPAQAQRNELSPWGWLTLFWQGWFGVGAPAPTSGQDLDHQVLPAGQAADPFGRLQLVAPVPAATDETDAGNAADPFG